MLVFPSVCLFLISSLGSWRNRDCSVCVASCVRRIANVWFFLCTPTACLSVTNVTAALVATKCDAAESAREVDAASIAAAFPYLAGHFTTSGSAINSQRDCLQAMLRHVVGSGKGKVIPGELDWSVTPEPTPDSQAQSYFCSGLLVYRYIGLITKDRTPQHRMPIPGRFLACMTSHILAASPSLGGRLPAKSAISLSPRSVETNALVCPSR